MKALICFLVLTLASPDAHAKDKETFWQRLFAPTPKPKMVRKRRIAPRQKTPPVSKPKPSPTPEVLRNSTGCYIVDQQWYANYLVREAAWDYYIPDDDGIKFVDGLYHVPPVVYRHFQDMVAAGDPKR